LPYNRTQTSVFSWSPDSRKLAYVAQRSGARNIWLVTADGTSDLQLTNNRDANMLPESPLWSADGKWIAYIAKPNQIAGQVTYDVWQVNVETKESKLILHSDTHLRLLGWSESAKGLLLASTKGKAFDALTAVDFFEVSLADGALRTIATEPSTYRYNIHLSPDRHTIAYVAHRDGNDNIWTIALSGGTARMITANRDPRMYFSSLAWSPDNGTIFFGKQSRYSLLSMITNFN
jgi:Tol biopolymer transport system component